MATIIEIMFSQTFKDRQNKVESKNTRTYRFYIGGGFG